MDDKSIIDLLFARSDSVLEQIQIKYGALCHTVAFSILASNQDAEECQNDVLMKLWNSIPPDKPDSLKAYIVRITRNLSLDRLRYKKSRKRNSVGDVPLSELEACISGDNSPEDKVLSDELGRIINLFLRELDSEQRFVFIARYWNYRSINSIASQLGMTNGRVKSLLFRLRGRLKEKLENEGF